MVADPLVEWVEGKGGTYTSAFMSEKGGEREGSILIVSWLTGVVVRSLSLSLSLQITQVLGVGIIILFS